MTQKWQYLTVGDLTDTLLDELGTEGWELVGFGGPSYRPGISGGRAYFKRPVQDGERSDPRRVAPKPVELQTKATTVAGAKRNGR